MGLPETQNEKDERVEALWRTINIENKSRIDLLAFKDGLRRIDHPMKDAHDLLKAVVKIMARSGEGTISFEGRYNLGARLLCHPIALAQSLFPVYSQSFQDTADMLCRLSHIR